MDQSPGPPFQACSVSLVPWKAIREEGGSGSKLPRDSEPAPAAGFCQGGEPANLASLDAAPPALPYCLFQLRGSQGQLNDCQVLSLLGGMHPGKKPQPHGREEHLQEPENKCLLKCGASGALHAPPSSEAGSPGPPPGPARLCRQAAQHKTSSGMRRTISRPGTSPLLSLTRLPMAGARCRVSTSCLKHEVLACLPGARD